MFIRILNSEMELATGCTEPGAVALTAAEAGCALRRAGANTVEEVLVSASVNIIKNAMSAGIPGTSYEGMDYAAAIGAVGGDPVHLLEVMNYVAPEQVEQAAALVKAGKVKVEVAQVPQKLYVDVTVKGEGHTGRAVVRTCTPMWCWSSRTARPRWTRRTPRPSLRTDATWCRRKRSPLS